MPGFPRVLLAVVDAYRNKPEDVAKNVDQIVAALARMSVLSETGNELSVEVVTRGAEGLTPAYDAAHGGFGRAPQVPQRRGLQPVPAVLPAVGKRAVQGDDHRDASENCPGGHVRPARRRLPPVLRG